MRQFDFIEPEELSSSDRIAIYGYGSQGITFYDNLMRSASRPDVVGFIDSYQSTEHEGLPVYKFSDLPREFFSGIKVIIASIFWLQIYESFKSMPDVEVYILNPNTATNAEKYYDMIVKNVNVFSRLNMIEVSDLEKDPARKIILHRSHEYNPLGIQNTYLETRINHHNKSVIDATLSKCPDCTIVLRPSADMDSYFYYNILSRIEDGVKVCILPPKTRHIKAFVIDEISCLYILIPKCATTAICRILQDDFNEGKQSDGFSDYNSPMKIINIETFDFSKYFTFTYIRNPYERIASLFTRSFLTKEYMNDALCKQYSTNELEFSQLVDFVSKCPDFNSDVHFKSQYQFITRSDGSYVTDFIGDLGNFDDHWDQIHARTGLNPIKKANTSGLNNELLKEFYTEELKDKVYARYEKDFELPLGMIE